MAIKAPLNNITVNLGGNGCETTAQVRQLKEVSFICWSESLQVKYNFDSLEMLIKHLLYIVGAYQYAFIIHNNDLNEKGEIKKEHIHVIIKFEKRVSVDRLGKVFCISPTLIQKLESFRLSLRYFIHIDFINKYQYKLSDIVSNVPNLDLLINLDTSSFTLAYNTCINFINDYKNKQHTKPLLSMVISFMLSQGYETFIKSNIYLISMLCKE